MEKLKFKMDGFWYESWKLIWGGEYSSANVPPDNTCSYRWQLILAVFIEVILFPITIYRIAYIWAVETFNTGWVRVHGLAGHVVPLLFLALFAVAGLVFVDTETKVYEWYYMLYGVGVVLGILLCIAGFVTAGEWIIAKTHDINLASAADSATPDTVKVLYRGWKDKYCSPIEWIKRDNLDG